MIRSAFVKADGWKTLDSFWNSTATAFFKAPAGAQIKILYGGWWFSVDRQRQTLDGETFKKLTVSGWSFLSARIQMKVSHDVNVTYDLYPGTVAIKSPEIPF
jgi:hypothetical protein